MEKELETTLLSFFKAMADANRLKIIGILANEPCSVEKLASQLNLSEPTISHHLNKLAEAGLVSAQADSYYSLYSLEKDNLEKLAKKILASETLPLLAKDVDVDKYDRKVINDFTNPDGTIKAFPVQKKKMDILLAYTAKAFELHRVYTEKEVNELLLAFNEDFASLRRYLIVIKYMEREGGRYWLTELGYNSSRRYR